MLQRKKSPNKGLWSPIGGKLDTESGESPHQAAIRETQEETGMVVGYSDLHLFCMISEKSYEGAGHWLMFLFECRKPLDRQPEPIEEGVFSFFSRQEVDGLHIPETDRQGLWNIYDTRRNGFVSARVDCGAGMPIDIVLEQSIR